MFISRIKQHSDLFVSWLDAYCWCLRGSFYTQEVTCLHSQFPGLVGSQQKEGSPVFTPPLPFLPLCASCLSHLICSLPLCLLFHSQKLHTALVWTCLPGFGGDSLYPDTCCLKVNVGVAIAFVILLIVECVCTCMCVQMHVCEHLRPGACVCAPVHASTHVHSVPLRRCGHILCCGSCRAVRSVYDT